MLMLIFVGIVILRPPMIAVAASGHLSKTAVLRLRLIEWLRCLFDHDSCLQVGSIFETVSFRAVTNTVRGV